MASWKTIPLGEAAAGTNADWEVASGGSLGMTQPDLWATPSTPEKADNQQPAIFSVQINVPSATDPEGSIFEIGGNPRGPYLGFDGSHNLIWRFSTGGTGRRVSVPLTAIPRDQTITIVAHLNFLGVNAPNFLSETPVRVPLQARVWVNERGYSAGYLDVDSAAALTNWSNTSAGLVNGKSGQIVSGESGNYDQAVTISGVTFVTGLRYYHNAIVEQPAENFDTINVIQTNDATRHAAWLNTGSRRVPWLSTGTLPIIWSSSEVLAKERVAWDHNRIADVKFEDDEEAQVVYDHNRESTVRQADEETAPVTWTNSKTCSVLWLDSQEAKVVF